MMQIRNALYQLCRHRWGSDRANRGRRSRLLEMG
jgi:hypothetical protein